MSGPQCGVLGGLVLWYTWIETACYVYLKGSYLSLILLLCSSPTYTLSASSFARRNKEKRLLELMLWILSTEHKQDYRHLRNGKLMRGPCEVGPVYPVAPASFAYSWRASPKEYLGPGPALFTMPSPHKVQISTSVCGKKFDLQQSRGRRKATPRVLRFGTCGRMHLRKLSPKADHFQRWSLWRIHSSKREMAL